MVRVAITPVKFFTCLATMVSAISLFGSILALFGDEYIGKTILPTGEQRFVVQDLNAAIAPPAFISSFYFSFGLFYYLFKEKLHNEYDRSRGFDVQKPPDPGPAMRFFGYCISSVLFFVAIALWLALAVLVPFQTIRTVTIGRDQVEFASCYRSWSVAKDEISEVATHKLPRDGKAGNCFSITATLKDGRTFRSDRESNCPDPGTPQEEEVSQLFSELAAQLREK